MSSTGLLTKCVRAGEYTDTDTGGVSTPIYTSSSYRYRADGEVCYPRYMNIPTQRAAADKIAALENAEAGLCLASGMAAITGVFLALLKAGDHAVIQSDIYGGTFHFVEAELSRFGIETTLAAAESPTQFKAALRDNTRLVYIETPSNPLMKIVDIAGVVKIAKDHGALTVIDNTFATPINQTPLDMGVDVVIHSGTKYLGGHSDLCCGAVATSADLMERIRETAINHGATLSPTSASLLERSMKTLAIRVRQHNENGMALAESLRGKPMVRAVHYPGLKSHPGHEIAARQMRGFGGMLSLDLDCDQQTAFKVVKRLKLFTHAVSLGGVESLVCFPSLTSHEKMNPEDRLKIGVTDSLIRISTGIEDPEDLVRDFAQALKV